MLPLTNTNNSIIDSVDENEVDELSMCFNDPDSLMEAAHLDSRSSAGNRERRSKLYNPLKSTRDEVRKDNEILHESNQPASLDTASVTNNQ